MTRYVIYAILTLALLGFLLGLFVMRNEGSDDSPEVVPARPYSALTPHSPDAAPPPSTVPIESVPLQASDEPSPGVPSTDSANPQTSVSRRMQASDKVKERLGKSAFYAVQELGGENLVLEVAELLPEQGDPRLLLITRRISEFGSIGSRVRLKFAGEMSSFAEAELAAGRGEPLPKDGRPAFDSTGAQAPYTLADNGRNFVVVRRGLSSEWDERFRQFDDEIHTLGRSLLESLRREIGQ